MYTFNKLEAEMNEKRHKIRSFEYGNGAIDTVDWWATAGIYIDHSILCENEPL